MGLSRTGYRYSPFLLPRGHKLACQPTPAVADRAVNLDLPDRVPPRRAGAGRSDDRITTSAMPPKDLNMSATIAGSWRLLPDNLKHRSVGQVKGLAASEDCTLAAGPL